MNYVHYGDFWRICITSNQSKKNSFNSDQTKTMFLYPQSYNSATLYTLKKWLALEIFLLFPAKRHYHACPICSKVHSSDVSLITATLESNNFALNCSGLSFSMNVNRPIGWKIANIIKKRYFLSWFQQKSIRIKTTLAWAFWE